MRERVFTKPEDYSSLTWQLTDQQMTEMAAKQREALGLPEPKHPQIVKFENKCRAYFRLNAKGNS